MILAKFRSRSLRCKSALVGTKFKDGAFSLSFSVVAGCKTMKPPDLTKFTRKDAAAWLSSLGQWCSGTKEELISRIKTYLKYPKFTQKLKLRTKHNSSFLCSLKSNEVLHVMAMISKSYVIWTQKLDLLLFYFEKISL